MEVTAASFTCSFLSSTPLLASSRPATLSAYMRCLSSLSFTPGPRTASMAMS